MEKVFNNDIEIGSLSHFSGYWEAKPNNGEARKFYKKEEAELYMKQVFDVESKFDKIIEAFEKHHNVTNVKEISINDAEEDGAVFLMLGTYKDDIEVLIELWAKDYCVDIYPNSNWSDTIFFGTLVIEH